MFRISEEQYKHLQWFAKYHTQGKRHIPSDDLVNEALMPFVEQNLSYNENAVKTAIKGMIKKQAQAAKQFEFAKSETDKFCKKCKEVRPIHAFRLMIDKRSLKQYYESRCFECESAAAIKHWQAIRNKPDYKEKNKVRVRKHIEKSRPRWNYYIKDRFKKEKQQLSDTYIIKLLRWKYGTEFLKQPENYHIIEAHRQKHLSKRVKLKAA